MDQKKNAQPEKKRSREQMLSNNDENAQLKKKRENFTCQDTLSIQANRVNKLEITNLDSLSDSASSLDQDVTDDDYINEEIQKYVDIDFLNSSNEEVNWLFNFVDTDARNRTTRASEMSVDDFWRFP